MAWRLRHAPVHPRAWATVQEAAQRYGVPDELIASVLADEQARRNLLDVGQDTALSFNFHAASGRATALQRQLERLSGRSVDTFSLGRAQMKPATLRRLGHLGYLEVPDHPDGQRRLLLDPAQAPHLVAACLRATADHWAARGVPILHRPEVLATLYSLGFTGARGVHPHPQASARGAAIARHAAWLAIRIDRTRSFTLGRG